MGKSVFFVLLFHLFGCYVAIFQSRSFDKALLDLKRDEGAMCSCSGCRGSKDCL